MNVRHLPGARAITAVLWTVLVIGAAAAVVMYLRQPLSSKAIDEKTTLSLLRSEAMSFLVTRRSAIQIVVEVQEGDWLGNWHGVLWATARFHYGVDLKKVGPQDIHRRSDAIIVKLPEPELLDFAVEPGSEGYMSKATAVPRLADLLANGHRRQMEARLRERGLDFASREGILPTRAELVGQLNAAAAMLDNAADVKLRFE